MKKMGGFKTLLALFFIFLGCLFDVGGVFRYTIVCALLHELGHIFTYFYIREEFPKVQVTPAGLSMSVGPADLEKKKEIVVAAAGPLCNFYLAMIFLMLANVRAAYGTYFFGCVNLLIGILNLLPLPFLDGGRILYLLFGIHKSRRFWLYLSNAFVCLILAALLAVLLLNSTSMMSKVSVIALCVYALLKSFRLKN